MEILIAAYAVLVVATVVKGISVYRINRKVETGLKIFEDHYRRVVGVL